MRVFQKKNIVILLFGLLQISWASAQQLQDSLITRIDDLFKNWNIPNSAGCVIGIVRNDSLLYAKGYGMANLEYGIPNSPETIFYIASVSKQFTAYAIVLLEQQEKLKLDDDVHLYLPWFTNIKEKITIRNLLNHTSGIRDQWQLLAISGTRIDDVITQDHVIKVLSMQRSLNFKPGEQYNYSNSGYTMLAEIVKAVTGQTLRQFTDSAIFKPLGMNNTHFQDNYTEVVKNRAYSYGGNKRTGFANSILSYSVTGSTGLMTTINDMAKWVMNFYNPKVGGQSGIDRLTQKGKLNDGKELTYASGIEVDDYRGWKQFSHSGGDAGYRSFVTVLPELKMGFIVFSNMGEFYPFAKAHEMADIFIDDNTPKPVSAPAAEGVRPPAQTPVYNTQTEQQLLAYTGVYECPELECKYGIALKDHGLVLTSNKYPDMKITLLDRDNLKNDSWFMSRLKITRDKENRITGFEVNDWRIMHLLFNKTR